MNAKVIFACIDAFAALAFTLIAASSQMQRVVALDVEMAKVGHGAAVVKQGDISVAVLAEDGLSLDGEPVTRDEMKRRASGKDVVLRAGREMPTGRTLQALADLVRAGANVSLEVSDQEE